MAAVSQPDDWCMCSTVNRQSRAGPRPRSDRLKNDLERAIRSIQVSALLVPQTLMESAPGDVTGLLRALTAGDREALAQLVAVLYQELRRIAYGYMRGEREGHTLQTGALINEAYLRLVGAHSVECEGRIHFLALAAQTMRRILVEHARSRAYLKRGGGMLRASLDEGMVIRRIAIRNYSHWTTL
jgi:ECF sigma factor